MTSEHPALPPAVSRPWIAVAAVVWCLAVSFSNLVAPAPMEPGPLAGDARLLSDPIDGRFGRWALIDTEEGVLLAEFSVSDILRRGSSIQFRGEVGGAPGERGAHRFRARLRIDSLSVSSDVVPLPVHVRLGQVLRDRVVKRLEPLSGGKALLAGFLIGDVSGVTRSDVEAMRRSGLSHFVAVSGSNVALFLGLLAVAAGPLALGPRRRAVVGLLGLPVYAAATGFEPSVLRASAMAGLALGGRLLGLVFEAWQLLSLAVVVVMVAAPNTASNAGFQLSVAATAGVLMGARWPVRGRVRRALAVTVGAQLMVAPLILVHFGSIPLMSPVANLIAAPLVAAATVLAAIGVAIFPPLTGVASLLAQSILVISRGASGWPQVGLFGLVVTVVALAMAVRLPRFRVQLLVGVAIVVVLMTLSPLRGIPGPGVVVLNVGQGDAILVSGGEGRFALVDGGPDPMLLVDRMENYGVDSLDLIVATHVHADHVTGLGGLLGEIPVNRMWMAAAPHSTAGSDALLTELARWGIPVETPMPGDSYQLGALTLHVEGPLRRYASPNDQSIVLTVEGPSRSMLLTGDIETYAQAELAHLKADVLKVPHQGAATSDADWLVGVGAELAVISVGTNSFGHPADWVIEVLAESGTEVVRTDEGGDIVVPLD